jgi:hypothetical protein
MPGYRRQAPGIRRQAFVSRIPVAGCWLPNYKIKINNRYMEAANERLFRLVHQEMVKFKPSLQKAIASGVEEEEYDDRKFLGQMIIKNFPLPVGVELRRLFSTSLRDPDSQRLEQILVTIEKSLQLISYILVSQLWNEKKQDKIIIPESFRKIFRQKIYLRNNDNFVWLIQTIKELLEERKIELFVPEMNAGFDEKFIKELDFPVPAKNPEGHFVITGDPSAIDKNCTEIEEKLIILLQRLSFLVNYKLVSVQHIKVSKPKYQNPKYNHVLKLLTCTDSDFNTFELQEPECADSHSVLLMKSQLPLTDHLNLSPLIIDTASFMVDVPATNNIKKDIFIYDGNQDSRLNYRGCRVTEKCDLSGLPDYPMLIAQFRDMMDTISGDQT